MLVPDGVCLKYDIGYITDISLTFQEMHSREVENFLYECASFTVHGSNPSVRPGRHRHAEQRRA